MIAAVIATACSTPPESPEVPPADAADVTTVSLALGPLMAAPGEEDTVCVVLPLGNSTSQVIRGIRTNLTPGSHHMIITRASGAEQSTPQSCGAFGISGDTLFIAEKADTELRYPDGAGLTVAANQMIGIEVHYINYVDTENPIPIIGTLELDMSPASSTSVRKVDLLFTGNFSLSLPPRQATTVQSFHELSEGVEIFSLTSHTHSLGTYAAIHRARGIDDPDAMMIHESESWSEPPFDVFDPPLVLDRSEGLRLTCEYFNPTDSEVTFGTDFDDEMCFMWVHYVVP